MQVIQQKTQGQLYKEALRPFQFGFICLGVLILFYELMLRLWILGVLLFLAPFLFTLIFVIVSFLFSLHGALINANIITDQQLRKKTKRILILDLFFSIILSLYFIYRLYVMNGVTG